MKILFNFLAYSIVIGMSRACGESPPLGEPTRKPSIYSRIQPYSGDRGGERRKRRNRDLTNRNLLSGFAGGKGGKRHRIPLGKPHGVKQGGAWGKERDLPYEASAGEPSEESAEVIVPERGRAEPNNRQSTNGSRKPHPDGKRREIGIRAERRKRQTHEPSRRSPKRSEH